MMPSQPLHGPIRTFINTCAHCQRGRMGTCPFVRYLNEHESAPAIVSTYDTRATANFAAAGLPCDKQISYEELRDLLEIQFESGPKPSDCRELNDFLLQLGRIVYDRLPRLAAPLKPVFRDAVPAAVFQLVSALDLFYLKHHYDIIEIILDHFPDYRRADVFSSYLLKYVTRACDLSCQVTLMDIAYDQELHCEEDVVVDPPCETEASSLTEQKEIEFIADRCRQIKADPTCDFLFCPKGDLWYFRADASVYAYFGLLLYKAMGKKDVSWTTMQKVVKLEGYKVGYAIKLASEMKKGKRRTPNECFAIKWAFPDLTVQEGPTEK